MSDKHTPEPWSLSDAKNAAGVILGGPSRSLHTGTTVQSQIASACLQEWMTSGERDANARRIVACVNACRGLSTDVLERMPTGGLLNATAELLTRRAQLLAALEMVVTDKAPGYHDCVDDGEAECAWCIARKAIAAARGEQ